jgi:hypothetical protein
MCSLGIGHGMGHFQVHSRISGEVRIVLVLNETTFDENQYNNGLLKQE